MNKSKDHVPISITAHEARAGLHEHRVHYVLAFGLAGGIIAFVAVGLYFGYDKLAQTISQMSLPSDPTTLIACAILIAFAAVGIVLLHHLWSMVSGGSLSQDGGERGGHRIGPAVARGPISGAGAGERVEILLVHRFTH